MIEVENLAHSFQDVRVFERISLTFRPHEFVSLFGPSGCGKTTLLRILAALLTPGAGRVAIDGLAPADDMDAYIRKFAVVWQDPRLLPWQTAEGNILYALEMRGRVADDGERRAKAQESLAFVGLASVAGRHPRELSGGMKQRVNLARALALDTDVVFMDEPLANLNEITDKRLLMEKIEDLWQTSRKTILYVTHSLNEALALSDRIVVFSPKPTRVLDVVPVTEPRPRDMTGAWAEGHRRHVAALLADAWW